MVRDGCELGKGVGVVVLMGWGCDGDEGGIVGWGMVGGLWRWVMWGWE